MQRPNILWYCTDQQRYDTIHCLGNPHIHTPNLDRLAGRGVAFTRAYTQSPICTPSRATFLTGRYPATHHVHRNGTDFFPPSEVLVTKLLAQAGYDCGLAGKLHLSRAKGRVEKRPDDGYRVFHWSHHPMPDWPEGHAYADWLRDDKGVDPDALWSPLRGLVYGDGVPEEYHQTTWCTDMAIRFITEKRDGPWLMSLNPFDPHPPFDPPAAYVARYDPEELPYPLFQEGDVERQRPFAEIDQQTRVATNPYLSYGDEADALGRGVDTASVPPAHYDARQVKACYYGMIELIDRQFGRIIDVLEETGQLENTIVIFTSDHGDLLGDHGLIYKGCRFFEALVHVPLIISFPRTFREGLRSPALVELVDLSPTLLEATGLPVPGFMQGRSLAPILSGQASSDYHKDHVVSEYYDAVALPGGTHGTMVFDGHYKSVVYHGHDVGEIYDLETDPGEFHNLWDDPEHTSLKASLLLRHLDALMATSSPGIPRTGDY
jgi:arylsulfatase